MSILDDLRTVYDQTHPILYYLVTDMIPDGKIIMATGDDFYPDVCSCHPNTWPRIQHDLARRYRLRDYRDWEPTPEARQRAIDQMMTTILEQMRAK